MQCEICENNLTFTWTDTHGVGACTRCSAPYIIYHYDDEKKRIEKPPELALKDTGVDIAKRYWKEKGRKVFPGSFDMGVLSGRSATYSGATPDDMREFANWCQANGA